MSEQTENQKSEVEGLQAVAKVPAKPPVVFISYSHDTPSHKKWVGELASKLADNGVEVLLDQWEIDLGDDIPKFMERSVTTADCVLMICTEAYVRKADDGKGGVGYEAMIVTGELVKNLGTAKFVPVIRQENGSKQVPKSMSTRFFADFSEGQNFDEQFEALLRKIHKVPKFKKPPIGKNPFDAEAVSVRAVLPEAAEPEIPESDVATQFYERASSAAQTNDLLQWRRILKDARQLGWQRIQKWRAKQDAAASKPSMDLPKATQDAFIAISPLFAVALAGVESGQEKFRNQVGIVDELLAPPQWNSAGYSVIANLPDALVFIYQALHGAICVETHQMSLAVQLARSHFRRPNAIRKETLFEEGPWVGWPASISDNCKVAWDFLCTLPNNLPWLLEMFGSKEDYLAALSAYYAVLNIMEVTQTIAKGQAGILNGGELHLEVPLCGFSIPRELVPRAYRVLTRDQAELKKVWELEGVSTETLATHWPAWVASCNIWLQQVYHQSRLFGPELYHRDLFEQPGFHVVRSPIVD